jgi:hypothetical protein
MSLLQSSHWKVTARSLKTALPIFRPLALVSPIAAPQCAHLKVNSSTPSPFTDGGASPLLLLMARPPIFKGF